MASESDSPTTFGSRNASFVAGRFGQPSLSPGLEQSQGQENSSIPAGYRASGTNQQIALSGIGDSAADAARRTYAGTYVPTSNGISSSTYAAKRPLMNSSLPVSPN
jgi:hypothetical protein